MTISEQVLKSFRTQQNNTVPVLAKQFNLTEWAVHKIINKSFKINN